MSYVFFMRFCLAWNSKNHLATEITEITEKNNRMKQRIGSRSARVAFFSVA